MKREKATQTGGWGCPHEDEGLCAKRDEECDPGASGCVLEERFEAGDGGIMRKKGSNDTPER